MAATITGRCSGPAPASAALAAIVSSVATPCRGASVATTSSARRSPRMRTTRERVTGRTGRPSPQPWVITNSWKASRSSGPMTVSAAAVAVTGAGSRVRALTTSSTMLSARLRTSSAATPPIGCDTVTTGSCGTPSAADAVRPREMNASVPRTTDGIPRPSSSTASWTLHDVQDPQSADPVGDVRDGRDLVVVRGRVRGAWFAPGPDRGGIRALYQQLRHAAEQDAGVRLGVVEDRDAAAVETRPPRGQTLHGDRRGTGRAHEVHTILLTTQSDECQTSGSRNAAISYSMCASAVNVVDVRSRSTPSTTPMRKMSRTPGISYCTWTEAKSSAVRRTPNRGCNAPRKTASSPTPAAIATSGAPTHGETFAKVSEKRPSRP